MSQSQSVRLVPLPLVRPARAVVTFLPEIEALMREVKGLAQAGAEDGTLVLRESRTLERGGRRKRVKVPAGAILLFAAVMRPSRLQLDLPTLATTATASVAAAIEDGSPTLVTAARGHLFVAGRKVGRVLVEDTEGPDRTRRLIVGVGISVAVEPLDLPAEVGERATSLGGATGGRVHRGDLLARVLVNLQRDVSGARETGSQSIAHATVTTDDEDTPAMILPSMRRRRHLRKAYLDGGGRDEFRALFPSRHERYPAERSDERATEAQPGDAASENWRSDTAA